jgi:hypothetical protein
MTSIFGKLKELADSITGTQKNQRSATTVFFGALYSDSGRLYDQIRISSRRRYKHRAFKIKNQIAPRRIIYKGEPIKIRASKVEVF